MEAACAYQMALVFQVVTIAMRGLIKVPKVLASRRLQRPYHRLQNSSGAQALISRIPVIGPSLPSRPSPLRMERAPAAVNKAADAVAVRRRSLLPILDAVVLVSIITLMHVTASRPVHMCCILSVMVTAAVQRVLPLLLDIAIRDSMLFKVGIASLYAIKRWKFCLILVKCP